MSAKVYFSKNITPEEVVRLFDAVGVELTGNVAVKIHSGEEGNQNFLKPDFWKPMAEKVKGTVVECNTAYDGARNTTAKHMQLIKKHGWNDTFEDFDLMDAEGPDAEIPVANGKRIDATIVGKNLLKYNSLLVLAHFKGHPMGGYGGALKQLSIGCASSRGKELLHGGGDFSKVWTCEQDAFLEAMADAAAAVATHFKGKAVYINVMKNLSVDCDCCAVAEDPCMKDIGILASDDPIAIDQACIDLIYAAKDDPGQQHFIDRVERQNGIHTIEAAAELGFGSREYELIEL